MKPAMPAPKPLLVVRRLHGALGREGLLGVREVA